MLGHGGEEQGEVYVDQFKRQVEQARSIDGNGNGNGNGSLPSSKDDISSILLRKRRCIPCIPCIRCMFDFVRLLALPLGVLVSD